jgi:hypothetical protein
MRATPSTLSILLAAGLRDGKSYSVDADGTVREVELTEEEERAMEAWRREQQNPRVAG